MDGVPGSSPPSGAFPAGSPLPAGLLLLPLSARVLLSEEPPPPSPPSAGVGPTSTRLDTAAAREDGYGGGGGMPFEA